MHPVFLKPVQGAGCISFVFLFCCHLSHILGAEITQGQDEPAQRFLRQGGKPGTLIRNLGRAEDVHAVCTGLYPGAVASGNVLDAQSVSRRQQGGEAQVGRGSGLLGQLAGQFAGIQGDALDAQSLGGFLGGIHNGVMEVAVK